MYAVVVAHQLEHFRAGRADVHGHVALVADPDRDRIAGRGACLRTAVLALLGRIVAATRDRSRVTVISGGTLALDSPIGLVIWPVDAVDHAILAGVRDVGVRDNGVPMRRPRKSLPVRQPFLARHIDGRAVGRGIAADVRNSGPVGVRGRSRGDQRRDTDEDKERADTKTREQAEP
jgi:hypothetical protein